MKVGFNALPIAAGQLAEASHAGESAGFESIWVPDHVVFPSGTDSRYPYSADGSSPVGPNTPFLEPLTALAHVAAVTSKLMLGTAVYILPLRKPAVTAKAAATVDALSGGRLLFGVGTGWMAEEFAIVHEPFDHRFARTEECIAAIRALWAGETSFHGEYYQFTGAHMEPRPKSLPPIILGGETTMALRRAARLGDGWIGMHQTGDSVRPIIEALRGHRAEAGRTGPFEITVLGGASPDVQLLQALADAGVDRTIVYPFLRGIPAAESLQRYGEEVITRI